MLYAALVYLSRFVRTKSGVRRRLIEESTNRLLSIDEQSNTIAQTWHVHGLRFIEPRSNGIMKIDP